MVKQLVRADHRVVEGSSKSIGEDARVSHFVRSLGKEREVEEGGFKVIRRWGHVADQQLTGEMTSS